MVRYRRNFVPGGTYFFTVTLADRTSSAIVHHLGALRIAFRIARHERPFTIEAIVILPEHCMPSGRCRRLVAAGVPVKRHRNGEYALWQRRFWEQTIRNEIDFERHVDYVHFNPVKHKLVSRALEWPYSSFRVYVRRGPMPADWAGDVEEPMMDFGERTG